MGKRRPSLISIIVISIILVIFVALIVIFAIKAFNSGDNSKAQNVVTADKVLNSIEGEQNCIVESDGRKVNNSEELQNKENVDDFIIESFQVYSKDNYTTITFDIYNSKSEDRTFGDYALKIFDDSMNIVDTINDEVGTIGGLTRKTVSLELKGDVANLFDVQVEKIVSVEI